MKGQNKNPLVSIVTPSYNQGSFIEETIESVLNQDYPNIEYIVVDGGSTDNTLDILKKYEGRLKWVSEKDSGQSDAINKGFSMARGEILAWLNSDDTYLAGAVRKAVEFLKDRPDTKMVYGKGYLIDEEGNITGQCPTEPFNIERLASFNYILQPAAFLRAEIFNTIEMLDVNLKYSMDLDLWVRIANNFKTEYLPEFLATYRLHSTSKTVSEAVVFNKEELETFKKHFGRAPANWLYGYVYYLVASEYPFLKRVKPLFFLFVIGYFVFEYIRLNKKLPFAELWSIDKGVMKKLKKSWDELGKF
jgi:glycosyltransferase involved in cell wall biosynthesis